MRALVGVASMTGTLLACAAVPAAQDLGPHVQKIRDWIYVYSAADQDSNVGIILAEGGAMLIDSGQTIADARAVLGIVGKLTPQPVRSVIHTEPHGDHSVGDFVFSPPASVIAVSGASALIQQNAAPADPTYRRVAPQIEYETRMQHNVGGRTLELLHMGNVHSGADTAVWIPSERVLFAGAAVGVKRYPNLRPFLTIPDILAAIKRMRALNPEVVIPAHGRPGTTQIFDEMERYYALLVERVGKLAAEGRTLDQVKAELRMPEFDDWTAPERIPTNVDAAWRALNRQ
jgi:cyclase